MSEFKAGWEPPTDTPYVMAAIVQATVRQDVPVAEITLYDIMNDTRTFHLDERVVWDLHRGLGQLLEQLHRPR